MIKHGIDWEKLKLRMIDCGIKKEDIEEKFIKAPGRGGQKVNKTSSAVFVKHIPTGISVKCSSGRSQYLNRFLALRRLLDRLENDDSKFVSDKKKKIERIRKQKKKRKKRAITKILKKKIQNGRSDDNAEPDD